MLLPVNYLTEHTLLTPHVPKSVCVCNGILSRDIKVFIHPKNICGVTIDHGMCPDLNS